MNTTDTTLDSISTITRYLSKDGKEHKTAQDAINHNKLIELCEWYEKNKIYGRYEGCRIEWEDFIEWCNDNKKELKNILNALKGVTKKDNIILLKGATKTNHIIRTVGAIGSDYILRSNGTKLHDYIIDQIGTTEAEHIIL